ncbi:hypothetical protein [Pseudobacteriovorax antillogorgiicola]|uniref:Concanavalin A-like lectin/glucanases superfamily protein n=1 Tax=Pseudobacteriovorax antillogorgiicola TaxID=1513793 RepID=A0A1Y6BTI8_9BACT|nr:hypothetical protein [Pseudobacteriovorax antillogorgiicola]TCS53032.1 hypothetical protein EDD56_10883 [Pseudobacteriovorax antillogorgiicola]SMF26762.1 hypothetical protein SAMN06296036_108164 [Pseudobacteriovorax antillogorgiicola]
MKTLPSALILIATWGCKNPLGEFTKVSPSFNAEEELNLDNIPQILGLTNGVEYTQDRTFSWSCDIPCTVSISIDQLPDSAPDSSFSEIFTAEIPDQSEGTYYLHIQAQGTQGQLGEVIHVSRLVDVVGPEATRLDVANLTSGASQSPTLTWTQATDNGAGFSYSEVAFFLESGDGVCDANDSTVLMDWIRVPDSVDPSSGYSFSANDLDGNQQTISLAIGTLSYCAGLREADSLGNLGAVVYSDPWSRFSPSDITGLQLWYDGSDETTLFTDTACTSQVTTGGDSVRCWKDKTDLNNGEHGTEATDFPTYQTNVKNSLSAVRFSGNLLTIAAAGTGPIHNVDTGPFSVAAAFSIGSTGGANSQPIIWGADAGGTRGFMFGGIPSSVPGHIGAALGGTIANTGVTLDTTGYNAYAISRDSASNGKFYNNFGAEQTLTISGSSENAFEAYRLGGDGGTEKYDGDMLEVLFFDTQLSDDEVEALKTYFADKWDFSF